MLSHRIIFVFVNVGVNLLFLVRSYITMRLLSYSELGLVALLQTIILLVAALQFGIVNGGYRLVCSESDAGVRAVNNQVYTLAGVLSVILFAAGAIAALMAPDRDSALVILLAIGAGILTILKNWLTNFLIAKVMLPSVNAINLVSALAAIAPFAFTKSNPLVVCLGSLVLQPLVFVACVLLFKPDLRPTGLTWSFALIAKILSAGFVVFLTGIFLVLNAQFERWSILSFQGTPGLGRYYLALVFLNLYTLIPTSLDAIYLPKLVQAYAAANNAQVQRDMRRFVLALAAYSLAAIVAVLFVAPLFLKLLLPKYVDDLVFVYLVLPGVVLFGLTAPFAMVFNVLIQYRYYFYAYGVGTLATATLLGGYILGTGTISLEAVSLIKSLVYLTMSVIIMIGYSASARRFPAFRFRLSGTPHQPAS